MKFVILSLYLHFFYSHKVSVPVLQLMNSILGDLIFSASVIKCSCHLFF